MRLFTAGNELNDYTADEFAAYTVAESPTFNQPGGYRTPGGKGGKYYFYCPTNWGLKKDFTTGSMVVPGLPTSLGINECYIKFHFNNGTRQDGEWEFFRLFDGAGNVILKLCNADGGNPLVYFYVRRGDNTGFIAPSQYPFIGNQVWNKIELYVKFGTSGGIVTLWVNDILIGTATGNIAGPAAQTYFTAMALYNATIAGGGRNWNAYDNIAINAITDGAGNNIAGTYHNGRCSNGYVVNKYPTGPGGTSQLVNDFGTSTSNFAHVNQPLTTNPSGFVGTSTVNQKDKYTFQPPEPEFRGVNVVRQVALATRNGPTISHLKFAFTPAGGSEVQAPSGAGLVLPSGGYGFVSQHFEAGPSGLYTPADLGPTSEAGPVFVA